MFNDVELDDLELTGPRLLLRPWRADDVARVESVMSDRSMYEFLTLPDPYDAAVALDYLVQGGEQVRREGTALRSAVVDPSGRVVGSVSLRGLDADPELGYWIAADARGHGYAAEACRVLAELGFGRLGLTRITIRADVRNLASARTALAAGFAYDGTLRGAAPVAAAGPGDEAVFGRLATDAGTPVPYTYDPLPREGLGDGVITLRPLRPDDADELAETEDEVAQAVGFGGPSDHGVYERKAARAGLELLVGLRADLAIVDDATGGFAGMLTVRRAGPPGVGGVGYGVHPLFRGRGYTARALRLLAPWAFAHGFVRLELGAKAHNIASQRAALAAGFEPDGVRRGRLRNPDGTYSDENRFALPAPHPSAIVRSATPSAVPPADTDSITFPE